MHALHPLRSLDPNSVVVEKPELNLLYVVLMVVPYRLNVVDTLFRFFHGNFPSVRVGMLCRKWIFHYGCRSGFSRGSGILTPCKR